MTNPTITNEQLEAWAKLGPWEWQKLAEFSSPKHSLGPGVLLTDERDGTPWGDTIDQTNAALIAAAPALAAALLAEREAASGELERLRAALSRMLLEFDFMVEAGLIPDTRNDVIFVEARAALKGWTE